MSGDIENPGFETSEDGWTATGGRLIFSSNNEAAMRSAGIEAVIRTHVLDLFRDGSGRGECAPYPLDKPICGWSGHASDHPRHVAEVIAGLPGGVRAPVDGVDEAKLEDFVRGHLITSWARLYDAHCWTIRNDGVPRWDRGWSVRAESIADDIRAATELVGPVDPENIGMSMLLSGWFARAVERIGLPNQPMPSEQLLAECQRRHDEQEARLG